MSRRVGSHRVIAPHPNLPPVPPASKSKRQPPAAKNLRWTAMAVASVLSEAGEQTAGVVARRVAAAAAESESESDAAVRNARRRVYDALKVMAAVGSVDKNGDDIRWIGVDHLQRQPTNEELEVLKLGAMNNFGGGGVNGNAIGGKSRRGRPSKKKQQQLQQQMELIKNSVKNNNSTSNNNSGMIVNQQQQQVVQEVTKASSIRVDMCKCRNRISRKRAIVNALQRRIDSFVALHKRRESLLSIPPPPASTSHPPPSLSTTTSTSSPSKSKPSSHQKQNQSTAIPSSTARRRAREAALPKLRFPFVLIRAHAPDVVYTTPGHDVVQLTTDRPFLPFTETDVVCMLADRWCPTARKRRARAARVARQKLKNITPEQAALQLQPGDAGILGLGGSGQDIGKKNMEEEEEEEDDDGDEDGNSGDDGFAAQETEDFMILRDPSLQNMNSEQHVVNTILANSVPPPPPPPPLPISIPLPDEYDLHEMNAATLDTQMEMRKENQPVEQLKNITNNKHEKKTKSELKTTAGLNDGTIDTLTQGLKVNDMPLPPPPPTPKSTPVKRKLKSIHSPSSSPSHSPPGKRARTNIINHDNNAPNDSNPLDDVVEPFKEHDILSMFDQPENQEDPHLKSDNNDAFDMIHNENDQSHRQVLKMPSPSIIVDLKTEDIEDDDDTGGDDNDDDDNSSASALMGGDVLSLPLFGDEDEANEDVDACLNNDLNAAVSSVTVTGLMAFMPPPEAVFEQVETSKICPPDPSTTTTAITTNTHI